MSPVPPHQFCLPQAQGMDIVDKLLDNRVYHCLGVYRVCILEPPDIHVVYRGF